MSTRDQTYFKGGERSKSKSKKGDISQRSSKSNKSSKSQKKKKKKGKKDIMDMDEEELAEFQQKEKAKSRGKSFEFSHV